MLARRIHRNGQSRKVRWRESLGSGASRSRPFRAAINRPNRPKPIPRSLPFSSREIIDCETPDIAESERWLQPTWKRRRFTIAPISSQPR